MNNTHPLQFICIRGLETAYRTGKPVGIFVAVWRLEQAGILTDDEKAIYHEIDVKKTFRIPSSMMMTRGV